MIPEINCSQFESVHHWWSWYPPIGVFIVISAIAAFAYPLVNRDPVSVLRKASWTLLIVGLSVLELRSIYRDRDDHIDEQKVADCKQLNEFGGIANKLKESIAANKDYFDQTVKNEEGILKTAKTVGELAKTNLENVTGADNFAYVTPGDTVNATVSTPIAHNDGRTVLSGVTITIAGIVDCKPPLKAVCADPSGALNPYVMGTLAPYTMTMIPRQLPTVDPAGTLWRYNINIDAQNGRAVEHLKFRKAQGGAGYEYSFEVFTKVHGKPRKTDIKDGVDYYRLQLSNGWKVADSGQ
jgi:hypothetical protein